MIELKLQNAEKLLARIRKVKTEKGLYRIATREGAKVIADEVRSSLPVRTGLTVKNVKVKSSKNRKQPGALVVVGEPGTETYRGWFLERGTKPRYTRRGVFRGMMRAGEYVRKAVERVRAKTLATIKDIIGSRVWR